MNYTWKTVYGDQRLVNLARQLRGESADSAEEEVNDDDDNSDEYDSDDYEFVNEEEDDNNNDEEEDALSSEEEEEAKESKFDKRWNDKYKQLKEYKAQNGHCNIPSNYETNKALGTWVGVQRQEYRKMSQGVHSRITQERVEKLENIGFSWVVLPSNDTWKEKFEELREFKLRQGHCNVPQNYGPNKALANWVCNQRTQYRHRSNGLNSQLTDERVEMLGNLGFVWRPQDIWNERYEQLQEFKSQHGHCNVPQDYKLNKTLGQWVSSQRQQYRFMKEGSESSRMTEARVEKLESIGFVWNKLKDTWKERYEQLREYQAQNGHCNVPYDYESNRALGVWVGCQRVNYRLMKEGSKSRITEEQIEKLTNIGFVWQQLEDTWSRRFEELKAYNVQNGHCNVSLCKNKALGNWIQTQRKQYRRMLEGSKTHMTSERVEKLESIGFEWIVKKDVWDERFEELKDFKSLHGHCNVPYQYEKNKSLGLWVGSQRQRLLKEGSKSCIMEERVEKLESIGFEWAPKKDAWNDRFEELKAYKAQNGHCNVPYRFKANKALGFWVKTQRSQYRLMKEGSKSPMTEEQVKKLENIGFSWVLRSKDTWNERFEELQHFKVQHGHCNVPWDYPANQVLGNWVHTQRTQYNRMLEGAKSNMTEERVEKLENIGFEWSLKKRRIARKNATVKKHSKKSIASKNPTVKRSSKKRIARKNATVERRSKRLRSKK